MKVYSPAEAASLLGIKTATLRKYSLLLETYGYEVERNSKKHRYYRDKDIITLRNVMTGSDSGITLEEAVINVVNLKGYNNETNVINNGEEANVNHMKELKEMLQQQNELIYNLTKKMDLQQTYIDKQINTRLIEFKDSHKQIESPEDKIDEILAEDKVRNILENEALQLWEKKPPKDRLKNKGWFRVTENIEKKAFFIKKHINENFEAYLKKEFNID